MQHNTHYSMNFNILLALALHLLRPEARKHENSANIDITSLAQPSYSSLPSLHLTELSQNGSLSQND